MLGAGNDEYDNLGREDTETEFCSCDDDAESERWEQEDRSDEKVDRSDEEKDGHTGNETTSQEQGVTAADANAVGEV
ncbi:hypothetical protein L916_02690, partial [Phytophthora nicotianae]